MGVPALLSMACFWLCETLESLLVDPFIYPLTHAVHGRLCVFDQHARALSCIRRLLVLLPVPLLHLFSPGPAKALNVGRAPPDGRLNSFGSQSDSGMDEEG